MNQETIEVVEEAFKKMVGGGLTTMREVKGISNKQMNAMYAVGFNLFNAGRLEDAKKVFNGLLILDHLERKYWFAMGAVLQQLKDFNEALKCYQVAAFLDIKIAKTQYQIAECHLALGDKENALNAIGAMFEYADLTGEQGEKYRAKAETLKKVIENIK